MNFKSSPLVAWRTPAGFRPVSTYRMYTPLRSRDLETAHVWLMRVLVQIGHYPDDWIEREIELSFSLGLDVLSEQLRTNRISLHAVGNLPPQATRELRYELTQGPWAHRWEGKYFEEEINSEVLMSRSERDRKAVERAFHRAGLKLPRKWKQT